LASASPHYDGGHGLARTEPLTMSGYVPNNRNAKTPPAPSPYNGDFDQQTPRSPAGSPRSSPECLVGIRFIWDNNEALPTSIPYLLTTDQGACLQGGLDARGSLVQTLPQGAYEAQLLANIDVDSAVTQARAELQTALDEILAA